MCDKVNMWTDKMNELTETESICSWFGVFLWYFWSCNFPLVYYLIKNLNFIWRGHSIKPLQPQLYIQRYLSIMDTI